MHVNPRIAALLNGLNHPSLPGIDLSLERMQELLAALGHPERRLPPTIHIAGTNGKGSTLAMLRSIYARAGYRVHAYTSPHLVRFNERIVLNGTEISDAALEPLLRRMTEAARAIPVTFFEATTAAAFLAFAEQPADLLLLEVGLGGRLDATNCAGNIVASVLTPIALDHREFLGDTVAAIATEKAGILRAGVPAVMAPQTAEAQEAVLDVADRVGTRIYGAAPLDVPLGLSGAHQRINAGVAAEVAALLAERFPLTKQQLAEGLAQAEWPARLQRLIRGPLVAAWPGPVMLDGGHNAHAAEALAAWAAGQGPVAMICGLMRRKEADAFLAPLIPVMARIAFIPIPGATDAYAPEELAARVPGALACADAAEAARALLAVGPATLLIAGSLHLAGEILKNHG